MVMTKLTAEEKKARRRQRDKDRYEKNKEKKIGFISAILNREHSVYKDRHQIIKKLADSNEVYFFTLDPLHESVKYNYGNAQHILLRGSLSTRNQYF